LLGLEVRRLQRGLDLRRLGRAGAIDRLGTASCELIAALSGEASVATVM